MGELRTKRETAKKDSEKKFTEAYKNWLKKLSEESQEGDPKAKAKLLVQGLADAGLAKGPKFSSYASFSEGLGPALDKVEHMNKGNEDGRERAADLRQEMDK